MSSSYFSSLPSLSSSVSSIDENDLSQEQRNLNYLAVGTVIREHIKRDTNDSNTLWFQQSHFINLQLDRLMNFIFDDLKVDEQGELKEMFGLLIYALTAKFKKPGGNRIYESLFSPDVTKKQLEYTWKQLEQNEVNRETHISKRQFEFLNSTVSSLDAAHFSSLTLNEFNLIDDISTELSNFTMPVQIDWDKMDEDMLTGFYQSLLERSIHQENLIVPEFAARCMIFWRGLSIQTKRDYFRLQKLDKALQNITRATGLDKLSRLIIERAKIVNNPNRDKSANSKVSGDKSVSLDTDEQQGTSIHEPTSLTRKALNVGCGPMDFFKLETVEEPVFDEIVLLYRKKDSSIENENPIFVQRFTTVPLKDYAHIFPAKRTGKNFADFFYFAMVGFWLLTMFFKLQHAWASATYLDEAAMGILFVFLPLLVRHVVKSVSNMRTHRQHQSIAESFLENNLQNNRTVLSYINDEAAKQEFLNIVLAYYVLMRSGNSAKMDLDIQKEVETLLQDQFSLKVDFNASNACNLAVKHGLCNFIPYSKSYQAVEPGTVIAQLKESLIDSVSKTFSDEQ